MENKTRSSKRYPWQRAYARGLGKFELMTAGELTKLSWARRVENLTAVPEIYLPYLLPLLAGPNDFPGGIITPTYAGFLRQENERLVVCLNEQLHVLERLRDGIAPVVFPLCSIDTVEIGVVLLKAWMTVKGMDAEGRSKQATVKFNAVTDRLFYPLVERIRCAEENAIERAIHYHTADRGPWTLDGLEAERSRFDVLETTSYKFMNYARRSLLPGEHVIRYALQPEMFQIRLHAFGRSVVRTLLSTAHLFILTDREVILISDDPDSPKGYNDGRYGGIWIYTPLQRIRSVVVESGLIGSLRLVVCTKGGSRLESLFDPSQRDAVEVLAGEIAGRIGELPVAP